MKVLRKRANFRQLIRHLFLEVAGKTTIIVNIYHCCQLSVQANFIRNYIELWV